MPPEHCALVVHLAWQVWSGPQPSAPTQSPALQHIPVEQVPAQVWPWEHLLPPEEQQIEPAPQPTEPSQPGTHAPAVHTLPAGHWLVFVQAAHRLLRHSWPAMQSDAAQQVPTTHSDEQHFCPPAQEPVQGVWQT